MIVREQRSRPMAWSDRRKIIPAWAVPFFALESIWEWLAYALSRWVFLEFLEYLSSLSLLVAVFFYFHDAPNRVKQRHYQAWQVINTAQGKGGSGGRIEALQELNSDGVPLVGVDVSGSFLMRLNLQGARLVRSDFSAADVRNSDFSNAVLDDSNLSSANFRQASFRNASLMAVHLDDADLTGADFSNAVLTGAVLDNAELRDAVLNAASWNAIGSMKGANISGVKSAPQGFREWALQHGAVEK